MIPVPQGLSVRPQYTKTEAEKTKPAIRPYWLCGWEGGVSEETFRKRADQRGGP